jgi:hypothetical protein
MDGTSPAREYSMNSLRDALKLGQDNGVAIGHVNVAELVLLKAVLATGLSSGAQI